jgi:large subunit ribosomal protein L6
MSRIGNATIPVPSGVDITIDGQNISTKGPKGELTYTMPEGISASVDGEELTIARPNDERDSKALHGLARSLVNNMVIGVTEGFRKDLEIIGVGYRAAAKGKNGLDLQLGFSHPVVYTAPDGIEFEVPDQQKISVIGIDKQAVGQVAAEIRAFRKPEPYKGKGIRYVGEHVIRKAGKAAK